MFAGDTLIKSKTKVVVVASEAHKMGDLTPEILDGDDMPDFFNVPKDKNLRTVWKQDCYSNRARIYFARELCVRYPDLTAVSVNPGSVRTDIGRNMPACMKCVAAPFALLMLKSPKEGAMPIVGCVNEEVLDRGGYFSEGKMVELSREQINPQIQKDLWDRTESFIKKH